MPLFKRNTLAHNWATLDFLRKEERGMSVEKRKHQYLPPELNRSTIFHLKTLIKFWLLTNPESREAEEIISSPCNLSQVLTLAPSIVPVIQYVWGINKVLQLLICLLWWWPCKWWRWPLVYCGWVYCWYCLNKSVRGRTNNDEGPRHSVGYRVESCQWNSEVLYPLWKGTSRELIGKMLVASLQSVQEAKHPKQMWEVLYSKILSNRNK